MYRHSLFCEDFEAADAVESYVQRQVDRVLEVFQSNDGESRHVEVRFFTAEKLSDRDMRYLLSAYPPDGGYALNCDDGQ